MPESPIGRYCGEQCTNLDPPARNPLEFPAHPPRDLATTIERIDYDGRSCIRMFQRRSAARNVRRTIAPTVVNITKTFDSSLPGT